jgi:hypothetical protein
MGMTSICIEPYLHLLIMWVKVRLLDRFEELEKCAHVDKDVC